MTSREIIIMLVAIGLYTVCQFNSGNKLVKQNFLPCALAVDPAFEVISS